MSSIGEKYVSDCTLFNLRLWVTDYFSGIINQVDILTERLLVVCEHGKLAKRKRKLNLMREKLINEIKLVEEVNFKELENNGDSIIIQIENVRIAHFSDKQWLISEISRILFKKFCIFMDFEELKKTSNYKLGLLIVTDWFLTESDIAFLKYFSNLNYYSKLFLK